MPRARDRKPGVPDYQNSWLFEKRRAEKTLKTAKQLEKQRLKSGYKYVETGNKTRKLIKPLKKPSFN